MRVFLFALTMAVAAAAAEPYQPGSADEVLEHVPSRASDPELQRLAGLQQTLQKDPKNVEVAVAVARAELSLASREGDPRYAGRAQSALAPWWDDKTPPHPVRLMRAMLRQHDHDFDAALADLEAAVREDPRDFQAWLVTASVRQVRGDYKGARVACSPLLTKVRPLVAATCLASIAAVTGGAKTGEFVLRQDLANDDGKDPASRGWAMVTLAELLASTGRATEAEAAFRDVLREAPRDSYALGAFADFLLHERRAAEAVELLKGRERADALLLRIALGEKQLGAPLLDEHVAMLRDRFDAMHARGDVVHRREEAMFRLHLAGDPQSALRLARDNWEVQKEPADARIVLEAALEANERTAARPVAEFLKASHSEDLQLAKLAAEVLR